MHDASPPTRTPTTAGAAAAARRFGAAALGQTPAPAGLLGESADPGQSAVRYRPPVRMATLAAAVLLLAGFLLGRWVADRGELTVWQAARPLAAGEAVTPAALRRATVDKATARGALPATTTLGGRVARVAVPAGALLTSDALELVPALPDSGEALVGVALAPGAAPADGLVAGDTVRVVRVPVSDSSPGLRSGGGGTVVVAFAPVWAVRPGKDGATIVTLQVSIAAADHIAGLGARGAVALERVARPG